MINDAHCHFFSPQFFETLGRQRPGGQLSGDATVSLLGWDSPHTTEALADRWTAELDRHGVSRAVLIASVPGDEDSVARAVVRHPDRFVGFFMLDPQSADAASRVEQAFDRGLTGVCLFPAMHRYALHDPVVAAVVGVVAKRRQQVNATIFVHCGALSVGVRKKLGLPSKFELRYGNPLDVHLLAAEHPEVPFIIPHFGAGLFREALMAGDLCSNVYLDTSSSNRWISYNPGLTLEGVLRQAIETLGPDRLLFGTDSSFFPRGWHRPVYEMQLAALEAAGADEAVQARILHENFDRLFPRR